KARDGEAAGPRLEPDVDLHSDGSFLRGATPKPPGYTHPGMIVELDEDDGVRHFQIRHPGLVIDGEAVNATPAGDLHRGHRSRPAGAAHPTGWERIGSAGGATLDDQPSLLGRIPERPRLFRHRRRYSYRCAHPSS